MNHSFFKIFPQKLRFWTFHGVLNALPSFGIALIFLGLYRNPMGIAAMILAVGTFIIGYSVITSLAGPFSTEEHILSQALVLGTKIRSWISAISLVCLLLSFSSFSTMMVTPDFWAGFGAAHIYQWIAHFFGAPVDLFENGDRAGFVEVFTTTILEGLLLSVAILLIAFFSVLFLQARNRKRAFLTPDPRHVDGI